MLEKYMYNGVVYNVAPHRLQEFLSKFPDATKVDQNQEMPVAGATQTAADMGKMPGVAPTDADVTSIVYSELASEDSSLESREKANEDIQLDLASQLNVFTKEIVGTGLDAKLQFRNWYEDPDEAVELLQTQFGDAFDFERTTSKHKIGDTEWELNMGLKISSKDGKRSITLKPKAGFVGETQDDQAVYDEMLNFMQSNMSEADAKAIADRQKEIEQATSIFSFEIRDRVNETWDPSKYEAEDLFDTYLIDVSTTRAPSSPGLRTGHSVGAGSFEHVIEKKQVQPYSEQIERAKKQLGFKTINEDNKSQIYDLARVMVKDDEYQKLYQKTLVDFMQNEMEGDEMLPSTLIQYQDAPEELKNMLTVGQKAFNAEYTAKLEYYQSNVDLFENSESVNRFNEVSSQLEDPDYEFDISKGGEVVELTDGRQVPKALLQEYESLQSEIKRNFGHFINVQNDLIDNRGFIEKKELQLDLLRRDYNDWKKFGTNVSYGFSSMLLNLTGTTENAEHQQMLSNFREEKRKAMAQYAPDVAFDEAFDSVNNFGTFVAQEVGNQIPVFTTLAIPYAGTFLLLQSTAGGKYSEMYEEEINSFGKIDYSVGEKILTSYGYAAPEAAFERLTTLPLMRGAKNSLSGLYGSGFRRLTREGIEQASGSALAPGKKFVYGSLLESAGEGATTITQNLIEGKPWYEDVDHSMFSGLMFGTGFGGVTYTSGMLYNKFGDFDSMEGIRLNLSEVHRLSTENNNLSTKIRLLGKGNRDVDGSRRKEAEAKQQENSNRIEELAKENADIVANTKESVFGRWLGWGKANNQNGMTAGAFDAYMRVTIEQERLRNEAEKILDSEGYTQDEKNRKLEKLQREFEALQYARDAFRNENKSEWFMVSQDKSQSEMVEEIKKEAENELIKEGNKNIKEADIDDRARVIYNTNKINENLRNGDKTKIGRKLKAFQTVEEFTTAINNMVKEAVKNKDKDLERDLREALVAVQQGAHGFDNSKLNQSFVVVENMAKDDRLETKTHELSHRFFTEAISMDPEVFSDLAKTVLEWSKENDSALYTRITRQAQRRASDDSLIEDEVIAVFLEEAAAGRVNLTEQSGGIGALLGFSTSAIMNDKYGVNMDFAGESDAIKFLVGLGKKLKAGKLTLKDIKAMEDSKVFQDLKERAEALEGAQKDQFEAAKEGLTREAKSRGITLEQLLNDIQSKREANIPAQKYSMTQEQVDNYAKNSDGSFMTKEEYDAEGAINAYLGLIEKGGIDGLILTQLRKNNIDVDAEGANVSGVPIDEFLERVREQIIPDILGFDPGKRKDDSDKFGLSGHINSRINWRIGDAMKKAKGEGVRPTTSLDEQIGDTGSRTIGENISDVDTSLEAFEELDLSMGSLDREAGTSELRSTYRQQLVDADGNKIVNEAVEEDIRQAVREIIIDLGPKATSENFLFDLEKLVKKKMKNIIQKRIGVKGAYRAFLIKNIDSIIENTTIQDLVALERKLGKKYPNAKKIFSVEVKKNLSPTEVDKAIADGKIKPDVGRTTGPSLYEKRRPTERELIAYFMGGYLTETMEDVLGYTVGGSTLGTRKDGLARMIVTEIAQDAVLETLQDPAVLEEVMAVNPDVATDVLISKIARDVNRSVDLKFSKPSKGVQLGADIIKTYGVNSSQFNSWWKDTAISDIDKDQVLAEFLNRGFEDWSVVFRDKWTRKQINTIRRRTGYSRRTPLSKIIEQLAIDRVAEATSNIDGYNVKYKRPTEKGGAADVTIIASGENGSQEIGIEVKGRTARGSSINMTVKQDGSYALTKNAEDFTNKEDFDIIESVAKDADTIMKDVIKEASKIGPVNYSSKGNLQLSKEQYEYVKTSGLRKKLYDLEYKVPASWVARMYLNKKVPSQYINIGDAGFFRLDQGTDPLMLGDKVNNFSDLDVEFPLTARLIRDSKSGTVAIRIEQQLDSRKIQKQGLNIFRENGANILGKSIEAGAKENNRKSIQKALSNSRSGNNFSKPQGMSVFDFDETVGLSDNYVIANRGKETIRISSEDWPVVGEQLRQDGWTFDFSDFDKVTDGKPGPLMEKLKNRIDKFGADNVYILTARSSNSELAIQEWLETQGVKLSIDNITGLGNSTGQAKAQWMVNKYAEGYNDMYFVDDAIQNVKAVQDVINAFDIKGKSVQARNKFSGNMSTEFNKMLERNKGVDYRKTFSRAIARHMGKKIGRFEFFIPPGADDFQGLMMRLEGKGKQGDLDRAWFKTVLLDPYNRAYTRLNEIKYTMMTEMADLNKKMPNIHKVLKKDFNSIFTNEQAIRIYLWNKHGMDVPGLSKEEVESIANEVAKNKNLVKYANRVEEIVRADNGYLEPKEHWTVETISSDLYNVIERVHRPKALEEWQRNVDEIFSEENINKLEAVMGSKYASALRDMLYRMQTGKNRPSGNDATTNKWINWVNNSVGAIMFLNVRSAVLQLLSTSNYINWADNNPISAAKAFANQKQYWTDFTMIFNSPMLKVRRSGLQIDVNQAELADAVEGSDNKAAAALAYLLKLGFSPTQIADSFAIASGGATFYRNRVKTYLAEGVSQKEAEAQAFTDFQELTEENQQSSRPDRISQQQASPLGRLILAFQNTAMQYNRLIKKSAMDLANKRGDAKTHVARIAYYGVAQSIIFYGLQQGLFSLLFDAEDDETNDVKLERTANGMLDSMLRGSGLKGAVASTVKNTVMKFMEESDKGFTADYGNVLVEALNISPPIGSKSRKLYSSFKSFKYNREVMSEMDWSDIDNPGWMMAASGTEAITNVPTYRILNKIDNIREAANADNAAWQRVGLAMGWNQWSLGIDPYKKTKEVKQDIRERKKEEKSKNKKTKTKINLY